MNLKVKLLVAAGVLLAAVGVFGYLTTGVVRGTEWSPDAVAHRSYEYRVVFGVPVGERTTEIFRTPLEQEILSRGYVRTAGGNERWRVVDQTGPLGRSVSNRQLYCWDENHAPEWVAWSHRSPDLAAQFWGVMIDKARSGREDSEVHRVLIEEAADVRQQTHFAGIQSIVSPVCRVRS